MENFKRPIIIFDTDMDTDCDDVGALAMLVNAHLSGRAELLGVVASSMCKYAAPTCEAILAYYGLSLPIGSIHPLDYDREEYSERFALYRAVNKYNISVGRDYNRIFSEELNKTDVNYRSAVETYRELLANADDRSVTLLCVGMLTAVTETLLSPPDSISQLSGKELFEKKVARVISMGITDDPNDFNWRTDGEAARIFFSLCPSPIYTSSEGEDVISGAHLTKSLSEDHILRRAYEMYLLEKNCGRSSWDLIATLYAIEPNTSYLECKTSGDLVYDTETNTTRTTQISSGRFQKILLARPKDELKAFLDGYMLGKVE